MMKHFYLALAFCFCVAFSALRAADSSDLDKMQGKWETKRTADDGTRVTFRLEITKDKLVFKLLNSSREVKFYGVGKLKADKFGPFKALVITEIKGGDSESDLSAIDDRTTIYQLRDGKMILASNLETERDTAPALDVYEKVSK